MGDTTNLDKDSIKGTVDDIVNKIDSGSSGTKSSKKTSSDYNSVQGSSDSETAGDEFSQSELQKKDYIKLDQSLFNGETVITLPNDNKLYATDENGKIKTDENGNPIRASWNEESLHKLRKSFVESTTSAVWDAIYNAGSYGFGYFLRTSTANITRALANRLTSWLTGSKNIICDATFYDPTDSQALFLPPNVNHPGRYVVKNAKLSVLSFVPQYTGSTADLPVQAGDEGWTTSKLDVKDEVMYEFAEEPSVDNEDYVTLGNLNLKFDFQSIRSAELWDDFLEHLAGKTNNPTRAGMAGKAEDVNPHAVMRLDLNIHKKGFGIIPYNPLVESPTFSLMVILLPHDNLRLDYDVAKPFIQRSYSFRIIKPREDNIRFEYNALSKKGKQWKFILSGHLKKSDIIKVKTRMPFDEVNKLSQRFEFKEATARVEFPIDKVAMLADGENGWEAKRLATVPIGGFQSLQSLGLGNNPAYLRGEELTDLIRTKVKLINDMLYNDNLDNAEIEERKKAGGVITTDSVSPEELPMLTLSKKIGEEVVETKNFFEFAKKTNSQFLGIELIKNTNVTKQRGNSMIRDTILDVKENNVVLAVYFKTPPFSDSETVKLGMKCWQDV